MTRLSAQLQRLYCLPGQQGRFHAPGTPAEDAPRLPVDGMLLALGPAGEGAVELQLESPTGEVRALVLEVRRTAHWEALAALQQACTTELELPAPALAVAGPAGYQLWISLAAPVPREQGAAFLAALVRRYLGDVPAQALGLAPGTPPASPLLPPGQLENGCWSAFIDPTLGSLFRDEPWLEFPPGGEQQADLLASLKSLAPAELERALAQLQAAAPAGTPARAATPPAPGLPLAGPYDNPRDFLLALMNDPRALPEHRLEAAKALLPYFPSSRS